MAKQIVIKKESLPPLDSNSSAYIIRYRIVSDDKSNVSYWSPIYVLPISVSYTVQEAKVNHNSGIVTAAWQPVDSMPNYDVFVSWSTTSLVYNWEYYGKVNGTSITAAVPDGMNRFSIKVFRTSQSPSINATPFLIAEKLDVTT